MSFKTTRGLMRHLRKRNIPIQGSRQKCQLMNMGYFHGYKGYVFLEVHHAKFPFKILMRYIRQYSMTAP